MSMLSSSRYDSHCASSSSPWYQRNPRNVYGATRRTIASYGALTRRSENGVTGGGHGHGPISASICGWVMPGWASFIAAMLLFHRSNTVCHSSASARICSSVLPAIAASYRSTYGRPASEPISVARLIQLVIDVPPM